VSPSINNSPSRKFLHGITLFELPFNDNSLRKIVKKSCMRIEIINCMNNRQLGWACSPEIAQGA